MSVEVFSWAKLNKDLPEDNLKEGMVGLVANVFEPTIEGEPVAMWQLFDDDTVLIGTYVVNLSSLEEAEVPERFKELWEDGH